MKIIHFCTSLKHKYKHKLYLYTNLYHGHMKNRILAGNGLKCTCYVNE